MLNAKSKTFFVFIAVMVALSTVLLIAGFKGYKKNNIKLPQLSKWSEEWNLMRSELYSGVPIDSGDIVFIGDSHIERFLLNDYYPDKPVRNRGIGSNTSFQVLPRLIPMLERYPSKVFVLIGVNDLAFGYSVDSTIKNIAVILRTIKMNRSKPYIISILPTRGADSYLNPAISEVNRLIQMYCMSKSVPYIDLYNQVLKGDELDSALTLDGTHLNSFGYKIFKTEVDKYINQ